MKNKWLTTVLKFPIGVFYVYCLAVLFSLFLTCLNIYQHPVFNPDGVTYFLTANIYLIQGVSAATYFFNAPFYSIIIALIHKVTHISLLDTFYLFNYCFSAITVILFIYIFQLLGGAKKNIWVAACVILCCIQFNHLRADIIRGHGYWVFLLLSLIFFIRFVKDFRMRDAICWSIMSLIALAFRVEGAVIWLLAPFLVFFYKNLSVRSRFYAFLKLNVLTLVFFLVAFVWVYVKHQSSLLVFQRINNLWDYLAIPQVVAIFQTKANALGQYVLMKHSDSYNQHYRFWLYGLIGVFFDSIFFQYTITFTFVTLYAVVKKLIPCSLRKQSVLWGYIFLNFLILIVFYSKHLFLAERYVMPLSLLLLCYVPFGLMGLYQKWKDRSHLRVTVHSFIFPLVCFMMLLMLVGSIVRFGHNKLCIYGASQWLKHKVSMSAKILTNENRIIILARGSLNDRKDNDQVSSLIAQNKLPDFINQYNYLVLYIPEDSPINVSFLKKKYSLKVLEIFYGNHKKDKTVILKIKTNQVTKK